MVGVKCAQLLIKNGKLKVENGKKNPIFFPRK
jgi:hypothetical protein